SHHRGQRVVPGRESSCHLRHRGCDCASARQLHRFYSLGKKCPVLRGSGLHYSLRDIEITKENKSTLPQLTFASTSNETDAVDRRRAPNRIQCLGVAALDVVERR